MIILLAADMSRHILKTGDTVILNRLEQWSARGDEIMLSAITYAELVAGALQTANRNKHIKLVASFCERLDHIVPWGSEAVDCYAAIQMEAAASGHSLNMNDAMLAAHAISLNAELYCLNGAHLSGIARLTLRGE